MAVALTITENGSVATVSGSGATSTNVLYYASWPYGSFAEAGRRTGDGEIALDLSAGFYNAYVYNYVGASTLTLWEVSLFPVVPGDESADADSMSNSVQFHVADGSSVSGPTLTIADRGDGTGAVATISNGTTFAANAVYVATWPSGAFLEAGSRVGNGVVVLDLTVGRYTAYVYSSLDSGTQRAYDVQLFPIVRTFGTFTSNEATSAMVQFDVTDQTQAIAYRALIALRDEIRGLSLSGISSDDILARKLPWNRNIDKPGIIVCPVAERLSSVVNDRDDTVYPFNVVIIRASNEDLEDGLDVIGGWRQAIRRALHHHPEAISASVSECYDVIVRPSTFVSPEAFARNYDVSAIAVDVVTREGRE